MDRRAIALTLALLLCASSGWARGLGVLGLGAAPAGFDCSGYRVFWAADSSTLDCYDADDGNTVTLTGVTASASGIEVVDTTDRATFPMTDGDNIISTSYEIGFKYRKTGTVPSYAAFYKDDSVSGAGNNIALFRDGTSNTNFRAYVRGESYTLTSTISTFYDGNEHTMSVVFNSSSNTISISVDGEAPVSTTTSLENYTDFTYLTIGNNSSSNTQAGGYIRDFYIK